MDDATLARPSEAARAATLPGMAEPILSDAFHHHVWATIRILDACAGLDAAQQKYNS